MKRKILNLLVIALCSASAAIALSQGPQEKTVEQTRKNIQVLKGLPDSQLVPVMFFMASSLGVQCVYCHVNTSGNNLAFESDDKDTKKIARQMIRMTFEINKNNHDIFDGTGAITCYTCHRGQTTPATLPALPVTWPSNAAVRPAAKADEKLPTVDEVLDRYVAALGGKAAIEKLKTRVMKGTQTGADGASQPFESYQAAPNKYAETLTTRNGAFSAGFNGMVGWASDWLAVGSQVKECATRAPIQ